MAQLMKFNLKKINSIIAFPVLVFCSFNATAGTSIIDLINKAKSDFQAIADQGEQARAKMQAGAQASEISMAVQSDVSEDKPPQLIVPKDKRIADAMNAALPTVKQVLSIHQCIKEHQSLRQLNIFAVPGLDMVNRSGASIFADGFPDGPKHMKFHDRNKCVSITTIDNWSMPALNALLFRAVYFATDSGETVNFLYMFKKMDDGSWKLSQIEKGQ